MRTFSPPAVGVQHYDFGDFVPKVFAFGRRKVVVCPLLTFGASAVQTELRVFEVTAAGLKPLGFSTGVPEYVNGGVYVDPRIGTLTTWSYRYSGVAASPSREWTDFRVYGFSNDRFKLSRNFLRSGKHLFEKGFAVLGAAIPRDHWGVSPHA